MTVNELIIANALIEHGTPSTWPYSRHLGHVAGWGPIRASTSLISRFYVHLHRSISKQKPTYRY